jgi:hypothetical protein
MLLLTPSVFGLFKWRQFEPEVILMVVGRYLRFSLSYRDFEELLAERELLVDHVTVWSTGATIDFVLSATRDAAAAERLLSYSAPSHQHRQARRLSSSHRAAQSRGRSGGKLWASTGAVPQQCSGTGSSSGQAAGQSKPCTASASMPESRH